MKLPSARFLEVAAPVVPSPELSARIANTLEDSGIVYFPQPPFRLPPDDLEFLRDQELADRRFHKNIAYRPRLDRITPHELDRSVKGRLLEIMRRYSQAATAFLETMVPLYVEGMEREYASFRPFQERGRNLRRRARNDLLHLDNFPTRPTRGKLILRFFSNISPNEAREWLTTDSFEEILNRFGGSAVPWPTSLAGIRGAGHRLLEALRRKGVPVVARPPYDAFMLSIHNHMKEDEAFQRDCKRYLLSFPPGSSWMVFTDKTPHAVVSGRLALEQTFLVAPTALFDPEKAPLHQLEKAARSRSLV